jgi:hypothetical protein
LVYLHAGSVSAPSVQLSEAQRLLGVEPTKRHIFFPFLICGCGSAGLDGRQRFRFRQSVYLRMSLCAPRPNLVLFEDVILSASAQSSMLSHRKYQLGVLSPFRLGPATIILFVLSAVAERTPSVTDTISSVVSLFVSSTAPRPAD